MIHKKGKREKKREEKKEGKEKKITRTMCVWNLLRSVRKSIGFLYNSMDLSSFGIEIIDILFGTLYLVYGLGLENPKLISCYG